VASGTNLYGTFAGDGIWQWNGSAWNQLTASNPEAIVASGSTLYGDFGEGGIWQWTGSAWNQLTASNPTSMVASGTNLYGISQRWHLAMDWFCLESVNSE